MITGIAHTAYTCKDMAQSLHFYCDLLGFKKKFSLRDDAGQPWIEYVEVAHLQFVELFHNGNTGAAKVPNETGYNHLCLQVDDIRALSDELKSKGVVLDVEVQQGKDFNWQCWVHDPDGNRIEFMQLSPQSPQMQ